MRHYRMLVGADWVEASTGARFSLVNPYTEEEWATVPEASPADVDAAVAAARRAFESPAWRGITAAQRARLLRRLGDLVAEHTDDLARLQVQENGKLWREVRPQTAALADFCHFYAGQAEGLYGHTVPVPLRDCVAYTVREPAGVVAAIVPWNSPLALLFWKLCPALAAGCVVVVKPSEVTPASALRVGELVREAGFPDGVVSVVTGAAGTGAALAGHPGVDRIAFTGSTAVGRLVAAAAAENLTRATLELGGKSPNIVFDDAEPEAAVNGVMAGIFGATGQTCLAGSRVLVQKSGYDEFMARLVSRAAAIRLGDPMDPETEMGTVACRAQHAKVRAYLSLAEEQGHEAVVGGARASVPSPGLFVPPTVFTDVGNDERLAREEIFGPVACVLPFDDEDMAVAIANDTPFGLAAGVWTRDLGRAHRMIARLRAGTVWVNTYRRLSYAMPFGGYGMSGIGRENGPEAALDYTETKAVWIDIGGGMADPFNPRG